MIFVLFFSLSYAKIHFLDILHNLMQNKTGKSCFITQNLFFGRLGKKRSPLKNSKRDDKHPLKKRSGFGKIAGTAFWQKRSTVLNAKRCSAREEGVSFCRPISGLYGNGLCPEIF
jgi:hypothetical protein